jgi:uncharacterized membrane protein
MVILTPIVYIFIYWNTLPSLIPLKYDADNNPIRMGTKNEFLLSILLIPIISGFTSLVLFHVDKVDPKKKYIGNLSQIIKFTWIFTIFMVLIEFIVINQAIAFQKLKWLQLNPNLIVTFVCLLLMLVGNLMNSVKQNYFLGIRTPWNLENELNWRRTHRLASRLWFFSGLLLAIGSLFFNTKYFVLIVVGVAFIITAIPYYYSYKIYQNMKGNKIDNN